MVLSFVGGGIGLLLGHWGTRLLVASVPDQLPQWAVFALDWRIVSFSVAASVLTTLLFGWAPVLQVGRASVASVLSAGSIRTTSSASGRRTLNGLVVAEVALALVLLVGGGLLLVAFQRLRAVDPGFQTENVLSFRLSLPPSIDNGNASPLRGILFVDRLLEQVRGLPGVKAAGAITCPPLTCHQGQFVEAEGASQPSPGQVDPVILIRMATPGYLEAMAIGVTRGRSFTETDGEAADAGVVIVNEMLAEQLWPSVADPTGRRLKIRGADQPWLTVVGVTRNVKHYGLDEPSRPGLYMPLRQNFRGNVSVLVHTAGDPVAIAPSVRTIVRDLDPDLPVFQVRSMAASLAESMALRQTYSRFLAAFAIVALVLAAGGLYGVVSYGVTQRTKEIGIRVALGARRDQLVRMVLGQGMVLVMLGLLIGTIGAMLAARLVASLLFGVDETDPLVFASAAVTLAAAAVLANLIPAWRAARLDPQAALREESV
jgi:predicted permease